MKGFGISKVWRSFGVVIAAALCCAYVFDICGFQTLVQHTLNQPLGLGAPLALAGLAPFPIVKEQTAIALAYRNSKLIADDVLPRIPVGKQEFMYFSYDKRDTLTIPDTTVQRKGKPNQVSFQATEVDGSAKGYGLDDSIPRDDIENAPPNFNPVNHSTEELTNFILLDREKRVSDLVFAAATYAAANRTQLSGNHQWDKFTQADADPIEDITVGLDACILRPNIMVIGRLAWSKIQQNPNICKAVNRTEGSKGMATRREVADLFELEDILVGEAFLNTAKKGQTAVIARVWGKHCALVYRDLTVKTTMGRPTFGFTAEWGGRIAGSWEDKDCGLRGGLRNRVGEYVGEYVMASDLGYFIQDAVA